LSIPARKKPRLEEPLPTTTDEAGQAETGATNGMVSDFDDGFSVEKECTSIQERLQTCRPTAKHTGMYQSSEVTSEMSLNVAATERNASSSQKTVKESIGLASQ
jgi:carboxypeptidase C (cathepsin A)